MTAGLYVHVPFCETKCGYCDFYSVPLHGRETAPLVACVTDELRRRTEPPGVQIHTIFVGGGTPTVLPPEDLGELFATLGDVAARNPIREFTVEANPATLDDQKLTILRRAGMDRLSMGAQSWHVAELAALERLHSPDDIAPGVALARDHDIRRLNLDLIFGITGQTLATWRESLLRTIDQGVEHISCYGLTYEPGTRLTALLRAGRIEPCDESLESDMYLAAIDLLAEHGYEQYEISNFAKPGERCLHNLIYWRNEPYIGIGPSAAGCVSGERYKNVADAADYITRMRRDGHAVTESERIDGLLLAGECVMMQLRLNEGIDTARFQQRTSIDIRRTLADCLARFEALGFVEDTGAAIRLTRRGRLLADSIISEMFRELGSDAETASAQRPADQTAQPLSVVSRSP